MANLQRIKEIAEKKGLSIRELAEKVGIGETRIHVLCRTNSTKIETLEKIAEVLKVPVRVFFDDDTTFVEEFHAYGDRGFVAKTIEKVDMRNESFEEKIELLNRLLQEKDERIADLKMQIADLRRLMQ